MRDILGFKGSGKRPKRNQTDYPETNQTEAPFLLGEIRWKMIQTVYSVTVIGGLLFGESGSRTVGKINISVPEKRRVTVGC